MLTPSGVAVVLTAAGRQALLDWTLGTTSIQAPDEVWFALCTSMPTDDATGDTLPEIPATWSDNTTGDPENITVTGYARTSYDFGLSANPGDPAAWVSLSLGSYTNATDIAFPTAVGRWPIVRGWAICDSAADGMVLAYGPLELAVNAEDTVVIPSGGLTLTTLPLEP